MGRTFYDATVAAGRAAGWQAENGPSAATPTAELASDGYWILGGDDWKVHSLPWFLFERELWPARAVIYLVKSF